MTNNDLINKIKRLETVEPSESWLASNREFLFKYIELDEKKKTEAGKELVFGSSAIKNRLSVVLAIFQNRMFAGTVALTAIFVLTANFIVGEAEGSLPGDRLYSVKTFMEKAQLAFAYNDEKRVALNFELTEKRLNEFSEIASSKDDNSSEVKAAADNLKNQLKVTAQELTSAKNDLNAEKAVSVAKIADTKTAAYTKKLNEVKKELSDKKQEQVIEVAQNVEELSNSALAVLATNSKAGDLNSEEVAAKLKEKIAAAKADIDETEKNVSLYEAEIKNSTAENAEAVESLALSKKLIIEARAVLAEAQSAFDASNFSKTWDLLVNAGEIAKVADSVGDRVAVSPDVTPEPSVVATPAASVSPEPSVVPSVSPQPSPKAAAGEAVPAISPTPSVVPEASVVPSPTLTPKATPAIVEPVL